MDLENEKFFFFYGITPGTNRALTEGTEAPNRVLTDGTEGWTKVGTQSLLT